VAVELLVPATPVIAVGFAETDPDLHGAAAGLAEAIERSDLGDVSIVASVNSGAGITPRAPLTELAGGEALEHEMARVVKKDVGDLGDIAPRLVAGGASCGLGPLLVLARLFEGVSMEVVAHVWPYGVGYLVARTAEAD
jgi:hypothetical protein